MDQVGSCCFTVRASYPDNGQFARGVIKECCRQVRERLTRIGNADIRNGHSP